MGISPHASLSRPRLVPVDKLPPGVEINHSKTPWQHICEVLVANQGKWFELTRPYANITSAVSSARKTLEADYPEDIASRLESAQLARPGGTVTVYLRIARDEEDDLPQGSLY